MFFNKMFINHLHLNKNFTPCQAFFTTILKFFKIFLIFFRFFMKTFRFILDLFLKCSNIEGVDIMENGEWRMENFFAGVIFYI